MSIASDEFRNAYPGASAALDNILGSGREEDREVRFDTSTKTGVLGLDTLLGGSLPAGVVDIYGPPMTGKTLLAYQILAQAQRDGYTTGITPTEELWPPYAEAVGIDLNELWVVPDDLMSCTPEAAKESIAAFLSNPDTVLVIDSLTHLRTETMNYYTYQDWTEWISGFVFNIKNNLGRGSCLVVTSQVRQRKSRGKSKTYTNTTKSTSEKVSSMFDTVLELSREDGLTPSARATVGLGSNKAFSMIVNIRANTIHPPGSWLKVSAVKGEGIHLYEDIVDVCVLLGVLTRDGGRIYFDGRFLGMGVDQAWKKIMGDEALKDEILDRMGHVGRE